MAITSFEGTILELGLCDETGSLSYPSTIAGDLSAAAFVWRAGADVNLVEETLQPPLSLDLFGWLNDLVQSGKIYYLMGRKIPFRYGVDRARIRQKRACLRQPSVCTTGRRSKFRSI
ncbi:MAG: hypothetical protein H0X01_00740 [Nitrospira sp.]|nr:hypothetical protein [Nitrospira sp.]